MISQDTARVASVDRSSTTGRDPGNERLILIIDLIFRFAEDAITVLL